MSKQIYQSRISYYDGGVSDLVVNVELHSGKDTTYNAKIFIPESKILEVADAIRKCGNIAKAVYHLNYHSVNKDENCRACISEGL